MYALCELYFLKSLYPLCNSRQQALQYSAYFGGCTAIHNHPSGGNFSSTDLHSFASVKNMNTLVATNNSKAYRITKGSDLWLKKNAKKYGYTYSYE